MGTVADAGSAAALHAAEIREGFLASLGPSFLAILYRRVALHQQSFLLVADEGDGVAGFAAATEDLGALYRAFIGRDGLRAAARCAPRLARAWPRVRETLRYPAGAQERPKAELVAVAVSSGRQGKGVGRALVEESKRELARRGAATTRVVAGSHNQAALGLYRSCGFRPVSDIEVHRGASSLELVWP